MDDRQTKLQSLTNLIKDDPDKFARRFHQNILTGHRMMSECLAMLVAARQSDRLQVLRNFRDDNGNTLLHVTAIFHKKTDLLKQLLHACPYLLTEPRVGEIKGQTALHIAIAKRNENATRVILEKAHTQSPEELRRLLHMPAVGVKFKDSAMAGEIPLTVAALTLNQSIVLLLLTSGAELLAINSQGDTVFHSLIKFAENKEKLEDIIKMMLFLNKHLIASQKRERSTFNKINVYGLWHVENRQHLTPLKLAAKTGQIEIFSTILDLGYSFLDQHDGVFDTHLVDITEIDTVTQHNWTYKKLTTGGDRRDVLRRLGQRFNSRRPMSVLEITGSLGSKQATRLLSAQVIQDVIKIKWLYYKKVYCVWLFFHMAFMIAFSCYGYIVGKADPPLNNTQTKSNIYNLGNATNSSISSLTPDFDTPATDHITFTSVFSFVNLAYGAILILLEMWRSCFLRQPWYFRLTHHNASYRLILLIFSCSLITDFVLYKINLNVTYPLLVATILGWWFLTFFLRPHKKFSFYTVMFLKILTGDLPRIFFIIFPVMLSFSLAIHIVLEPTQTDNEFNNLGTSMLAMFKLMLGLQDIEILLDAREPWLAVTVFVLFVVMTNILLVNSLIALMSQTCKVVSQDRHTQCQLQKLLVVLFLETMTPPAAPKKLFREKETRLYDIKSKHTTTESRYFIPVQSVQTEYSNGRAILNRKKVLRTQGFDNTALGNTLADSSSSSHEDLPETTLRLPTRANISSPYPKVDQIIQTSQSDEENKNNPYPKPLFEKKTPHKNKAVKRKKFPPSCRKASITPINTEPIYQTVLPKKQRNIVVITHSVSSDTGITEPYKDSVTNQQNHSTQCSFVDSDKPEEKQILNNSTRRVNKCLIEAATQTTPESNPQQMLIESPLELSYTPVNLPLTPVKLSETPMKSSEAPLGLPQTPLVMSETPMKLSEGLVKLSETPLKVSATAEPRSQALVILQAPAGKAFSRTNTDPASRTFIPEIYDFNTEH